MGPGGDSPAGEPATVSGLDVEGRVTDEQGSLGERGELSEGMVGKLGLRFQPRGVFGAEYSAEERGHAEVMTDAPRVIAAFIGEDGEGDAGGLLLTQQLECTGKQADVFE